MGIDAATSANRTLRPTWRVPDASYTGFFRFRDQFVRLKDHLKTTASKAPIIRILSAGPSTGEEPISALITAFRAIRELEAINPDFQAPQVEITAVEANQRNIDAFQANRYSICPRKIPDLIGWEEFFDPLPGTQAVFPSSYPSYGVGLKPQFHRLITYVRADLRSPSQLSEVIQRLKREKFTAIFFNVVTLYISDRSARRVFKAFKEELLAADGLLFYRD